MEPPAAEHADEAPAWRFVGPRDVAGLGADVLCGATDRRALLAEGRYGWRAFVFDGDTLLLPDGSATPRARWKLAIAAWTDGWREADRAVAAICGVKPETDLLLVLPPDAPVTTFEALVFHVDPARVRLLVTDAAHPARRRLDVGDSVAVLPFAASGRKTVLLQVIGTAGER